MKRIKPLSFKTETVRVLSNTELGAVAGGAYAATGNNCMQAGNASGGCQSTEPYYIDGVRYIYYGR